MRIAIVEDDVEQGRILSRLFESSGTNAEVFQTGRQFLHRANRSAFDLAMLDLRLPDMSGLEVLERLRAQEQLLLRTMPVMVVSGHPDLGLMKKAFAQGAHDFIAKPFRPDELVIRAEAAIHRHQPRLFHDGPIEIAGIRLNLATLQAFCDGREAGLSAKEFHLAWLLFHRQGQTVSRAQIMKLVWGRADSLACRTIDTHIGRIKRKLGLDKKPELRLRPVYAIGYRLDVFP
ncbi:MAG: response regulator transcription factor [Burkholderiaceae bacterium]|nr:response regulator transcription factor [Burkholderiaceae bacterium]